MLSDKVGIIIIVGKTEKHLFQWACVEYPQDSSLSKMLIMLREGLLNLLDERRVVL